MVGKVTNASSDIRGGDDPDHDKSRLHDEARLATIVRPCEQFAAAYPDPPLYRAICEGVARDPEVAELLLAASPGRERPMLLLAALHDLVLRLGMGGTAAARWYASVAGRDGLPPDRWIKAPGGR